MQKLTQCLWFNGDAEEAESFYITLLPNSRIDRVFRSPADTPIGPASSVLTVEFTLAGMQYVGLNGGPEFNFTESVSFQIHYDDQQEVDRLWASLLDCGDRWGLAWQIVPIRLEELLRDPDPERVRLNRPV
jgi:predicted 3-demethylubiquinone-9 3-methyltransferase (glyoxalase superfamily)